MKNYRIGWSAFRDREPDEPVIQGKPICQEYIESIVIRENTFFGILAEMEDISRFDDVKEIQKLSGLGLVVCNPDKQKGEKQTKGCFIG